MSRVHWLGAGLSTVPGIQLLANADLNLTVWNRTLDKASAALQGTTGFANGHAEARGLDFDVLNRSVEAGDVVVSMLPGDLHVQVAKLCIDNKAHFVSSSYIAPEMAALENDAKSAGVVLLNEVGLDPGIDHLFAHALVHEYKSSDVYSRDNRVYFRSYCGGVPAVPNKFKYKFSWSPFGVLKALTSPAQWIEHGSEQRIDTPWKAVTDYKVQTGKRKTEKFEAYPNRDSLPFMNDYQFDDNWQVEQFVRGTLRLAGWSKAWAHIFKEIESLSSSDMTQRLNAISDELWEEHAYAPDEADRVVLVVELEIRNSDDKAVWHQLRSVDDKGNAEGTSMARLVSHTVALAVQSVMDESFAPGVSAAPSNIDLVHQWLEKLSSLNEGFAHTIRV